MLTITLLLVLTACLLVYKIRQRAKHDRMIECIPAVPNAFPLIGNAYMLLGDSQDTFELIRVYSYKSNRAGGILRFLIGTQQFFIVTNPQVAHTIMNTSLSKSYMYDFSLNWVGRGLFNTTASRWKQQRKLLNPAFSQKVIDGYLDLFNRNAENLVEALSTKCGTGGFDVVPVLTDMTLENICQTVMGLPAETMKTVVDDRYTHTAKTLLDVLITRLQKFWFHSDILYYFSSLKKEENRLIKIAHEITWKVVRHRKTMLQNLPSVHGTDQEPNRLSFLDLLLDWHAKGHLSEAQVKEEVDSMLIAGYDTVATQVLYTLIVLGSLPDVQEKAYNELQEVFGSNSAVTKEGLSKLVYLDAVVKEVMRMYPTIGALDRRIDQDIKFDNFTLPAGSTAFILIWGIHRHPCWGDDAHHFDPQRWLQRRVPADLGAYAAFGLGRRVCIGRSYAYLSMKTTIVHILRRYRVEANLPNLELKFDLLTKPVCGHHISLELRDQ
ncbi:unnamed protein product [Plutella xylostella]|uniref:(diamondback moth) hypothetical protein n=1 Tax=Plutella xylostella TaxID=51655 RepID=A0A8S4GDY4_PLUXY|nr:unnamed protein product [Plutella xylostella]